jgi:hypothetical protein
MWRFTSHTLHQLVFAPALYVAVDQMRRRAYRNLALTDAFEVRHHRGSNHQMRVIQGRRVLVAAPQSCE